MNYMLCPGISHLRHKTTMHLRLLQLLFAFGFVITTNPYCARACSCDVDSYERVFCSSLTKHIFAGKIVQVTSASMNGFWVTYRVLRTWRGTTSSEITVYQGSTSCDKFFANRDGSFDSARIVLYIGQAGASPSAPTNAITTNSCLPSYFVNALDTARQFSQLDRISQSVLPCNVILDVQNQTKGDLSIVPNPVFSSSNLELTLLQATQVTIQVFDNLGKIVAPTNKIVMLEAGKHSIPLEAVSLSSGVYYCHILISNQRIVKRFIVLR